MIINRSAIIFLFLFSSASLFAQTGEFPGVWLRPEIRLIIKETETKAGKEIYRQFVLEDNFAWREFVPVTACQLF